MRYKVIISQLAQDDLTEITTYIITEFQNYISARKIYFALQTKIQQLPKTPFHQRYSSKYYRVKVGRYYIFYMIENDKIKIARILHGSRNISEILGINL